MQSFRTELENPLIEKDILELAQKIQLFKEGKIHDDKFRSIRLARGVYGQRQKGVQMVRIKLPYGKMTFKQWRKIADISDEYSIGNLHLTTRQDVQIHFVSLEKTPELWAKLEQDDITLREACGNTVRNVTASATAGIDPDEPFDVSPYADAVFQYFLRNPICQDMGRKIKIAFSSSEKDTALTFMHDFGCIPKIQNGKRGFRVLMGGGLGAQPMVAQMYADFLPEDQLIPTIEASLRVFDRHGERHNRSKARLKFLIQKIGFQSFTALIQEEWKSLKHKSFPIIIDEKKDYEVESNPLKGDLSTIFYQKQKGYFGLFVRIPNGNISSETSRKLIDKLEHLVGEIRITINQGLFFRFIKEENLEKVQFILEQNGLGKAGANGAANITSCPGTDTCNLAISDATHLSLKLEEVIENEFPHLVEDSQFQIKISGCMNSCGQHGMATIGFHGSSIKAPDKRVLPAVQLLLGGGAVGNGEGRIADKVLKIPSKRAPEALRRLLDDYESFAEEGDYFNNYYDKKGERYFYSLLKPLSDLTNLDESDFVDWGDDQAFKTEIGVGECAGIMIDLVAILLWEAEEKMISAEESFAENRFADAIYQAYTAQIQAAKGLLLDKNVNCSTQHGVISEFEKNYTDFKEFKTQILQLNQNEPNLDFAKTYLETAKNFVHSAAQSRT